MKGALSGAILVLLVMGGCVGTSDGQPEATPEPTAAPPGEFDEATGAISGVVTDPEFVPLSGAELLLKERELLAVSAQDGTFSFSRLEPGTYTIFAAKLGYTSASLKATAIAGQEVGGLKLTLEPIAVSEPRVMLYPFTGYITCTIGAFGVLSEECGEGLQTDYGTYGKNPNNKIDWKFNITEFDQLMDVYVEMNWKPGSAAANQLTLYVAHGFKCTPSCSSPGATTYCGTSNHGPPIQNCHRAGEDLGIKNTEKDLPWEVTARAWGAPVGPTEVPNIVLEQSFDMWRTEFFGEPMPEGYSAFPDA